MVQALEYTLQEYRKDLGILFFRWLTAINTEQIIAGYSQILEATDFSRMHCWLFDTRRRGKATAEAEEWYFTSYLPLLQASLQKPHYIAVLHSPVHFIHLRDVVGFDKVKSYTENSLLTMEFFDSEQKAVDWLVAMQQPPATQN